MASLSYYDIYPKAIEDATGTCESALEKAGCTKSEIDNVYSTARGQAFDALTAEGNITNCIIDSMYQVTKEVLEEKGYEVDYYVNGDDSHLYIGGEEYYEGDELPELTIDEPMSEFDRKFFDIAASDKLPDIPKDMIEEAAKQGKLLDLEDFSEACYDDRLYEHFEYGVSDFISEDVSDCFEISLSRPMEDDETNTYLDESDVSDAMWNVKKAISDVFDKNPVQAYVADNGEAFVVPVVYDTENKEYINFSYLDGAIDKAVPSEIEVAVTQTTGYNPEYGYVQEEYTDKVPIELENCPQALTEVFASLKEYGDESLRDLMDEMPRKFKDITNEISVQAKYEARKEEMTKPKEKQKDDISKGE